MLTFTYMYKMKNNLSGEEDWQVALNSRRGEYIER